MKKEKTSWSNDVYEKIIVEKPNGEKIILKNHENGNILDIDLNLEKDKFLHPEKYEEKVNRKK